METETKEYILKKNKLDQDSLKTKLSVIIVSYNVSGFLDHCLDSVIKACDKFEHEIIVIDNASTDETVNMVRAKYSNVKLIENAHNVGYSKANNQGIAISKGEFIIFLNPDTIVPSNAFTTSMEFLENRKDAGMMSLKIVNADGSFQPACRRGFPTPLAALCRLTGLSSLFPKSKLFGKYNLTYLDENETNRVDAVCGAFMMTKSTILKKIGGFDNDFFMFGEDIDLCYRFNKSGYKVYYYPATEVIHFKGESSKRNRIQSALNFYNSMFIFSKKYFGKNMGFFPRVFLFIGIFLNAIVKVTTGWLFKYIPHFMDIAFINFALFISLIIKFGVEDNFYTYTEPFLSLILHLTLTVPLLLTFTISGLYSGRPKTKLEYFKSIIIASLIFFTLVYFIPNVRFSRLAFMTTCLSMLITLPGWRLLLYGISIKLGTPIAKKRHIVIIGAGLKAETIYNKTKDIKGSTGVFHGFITEPCDSSKTDNNLIIGDTEHYKAIIKKNKINEVIVALSENSDMDILSLINFCIRSSINVKMVQSMYKDGKYHILDVNMSESSVV